MKRATKNRIITIFIILMFVGSSLTFAIISAVPSGQSAGGWKAGIIIVINGEQYPIPSDIGISNNETTGKVYTGNTDGVVYKTVPGDVKLKDFFDTWGNAFNSTCILNYCNTNTSSMKMYVWSGKWIENYDYNLYVIKSGDNILIDYR